MENNEKISYKLGKKLAIISYSLFLLQILVPFSGIIGLIIAYMNRGRVDDPILCDHFRFQIRIFWIEFFLSILFIFLCLILIGYFLLFGLFVWQTYMFILGLIRLIDDKPINI